MENTVQQSFSHTFDAEKLDDIRADAGEKGQSVEMFLAELTARYADVTRNIFVPSDAEAAFSNVGDKLIVTLTWTAPEGDTDPA